MKGRALDSRVGVGVGQGQVCGYALFVGGRGALVRGGRAACGSGCAARRARARAGWPHCALRRPASQSPGAHVSMAAWEMRHCTAAQSGTGERGHAPRVSLPWSGVQVAKRRTASAAAAPAPPPGASASVAAARPSAPLPQARIWRASSAPGAALSARARARRCARAPARFLAWASTRCCATSSSASLPSRTCPSSMARASRCRARPPATAGVPATRHVGLSQHDVQRLAGFSPASCARPLQPAPSARHSMRPAHP